MIPAIKDLQPHDRCVSGRLGREEARRV